MRNLIEGEREELARSAGREQTRGLVLQQPFNVIAIRRLVEREITLEMRDGEGEQSLPDTLRKLLRSHPAHSFPFE